MRLPQRALALALLLACAGPPAPYDRYYRIETPVPAARPAPVFEGIVEVDRFRADALTGGLRIVRREHAAAGELLPYSYHQWADPPTILLQTRLAEFLRAAQAAPLVVTPELRARADYAVLGRIERLEHVTGEETPRMLVELELTVTRERDRSVVLQRSYREQREASGPGVGEAVDAAGAAVGAIFERFLADASAELPR
jgi:ABC-type uncharacterized transport system auxiliary subunit